MMGGKDCPVAVLHSGKVAEKELVTETGLSPEQIERALTWHNLEAERWRQRFGGWKHGSEGEQ
ncbi:hypothetical protein [Streptomyces mirabilis]|uniref:hypothetical protein n=1 Tax=Streptomyces mirabilis TaxID=68239 RepID=UPI0036D99A1E